MHANSVCLCQNCRLLEMAAGMGKIILLCLRRAESSQWRVPGLWASLPGVTKGAARAWFLRALLTAKNAAEIWHKKQTANRLKTKESVPVRIFPQLIFVCCSRVPHARNAFHGGGQIRCKEIQRRSQSVDRNTLQHFGIPDPLCFAASADSPPPLPPSCHRQGAETGSGRMTTLLRCKLSVVR